MRWTKIRASFLSNPWQALRHAIRQLRKMFSKLGRSLRRGLLFRGSAHHSSPTIDWVVQGKLAIGPAPSSDFLPHLLGRRIEVILSLCSEAERPLPQELSDRFRCVRIPLPDSHYPQRLEVEELAEAVDLLHWHLLKRRPVYVHCLAGIERSPLICIAYLCRYQQMDLLDALSWVTHVHPPSRPRSHQLQVVRHYLQQTHSTFNYDLRL